MIVGLIFLFVAAGVAAPAGKVAGRVTDNNTGDPLPAANVFIEGTTYGSSSDLEGQFIIHSVPPGRYTLNVSYIGYQPKTMEVVVEPGRTTTMNVGLDFQTIEGEVVTVTAQAEGQIEAINQQLRSNTIANIVSKARIEELPDVNAAESVGRLPGVSIQRSGGEANKIEIRGLSPKYNTITVNGVRLPATGGDDRSVDLSLISSSMLDGITVKKANTPDMDADALGGTVDLRLKEAPVGLHVNVTSQGGYNQLQNYYGNYNFLGNISNRFYDDRLGVIASFNIDEYNRSADKFSGDYRRSTEALTGLTEIIPSNISLREETVTRGRTGGSLLLDYRIPAGKVTVNSFYNRLRWDGLFRVNRMDLLANRHYYDLEDRNGTTSIFTGSAGLEQDFGWMKYDVGYARTSSETDEPEGYAWTFVQENAAFKTAEVTAETHPNQIPLLATIDTSRTGLSSAYRRDNHRNEDESSLQLNVQVPYRLGQNISGFVKLGGKFRWLSRMNDEEQNGRDGLQYGAATGVSPSLTSILKYLDEKYPNEWNWIADSTLVRQHSVFPIERVLSDYARADFLDGEYPLGFAVDNKAMTQIMEAMFATGVNRRYAIGSRGRDYDGDEQYQAGYIMSEINIGKYLTLIPGVRYEKEHSEYHGQRYRELVVNNIQEEPKEFDEITTERDNEYWLPMYHAIIQPTDWLKIRLAQTKTLTRPDYIQYAPITSINSYQSYIRAANSSLKAAVSTNYDAAVSVYQNHIGLFTIAGFYKSIDDLIFQTGYKLMPGVPVLPGLNIPESWLKGAAPQMDTYINNPYEAKYKGFEVEWQTNFWYLPSFLRGLVLNVNYTNIQSEVQKQLFYNQQGDLIPGTRPPRRSNILVDSTRTARMPDQPAHIANVTLGYDYKGFSARLSYLYQTDKVTWISTEPILDNFTGAYERWDLTLQQNLLKGIQLFANLTNLNSRPDRSFRGSELVNPTYTEYYGFTIDVGIRYRM